MLDNHISTSQKACGTAPIKTKRLTHAQHALSNTTSLRKAVNAKCWDCCGGGLTFKESYGVRKQIAQCPMVDCSLHSFRPYKNEKTTVRLQPARGFNSSTRNNEVN